LTVDQLVNGAWKAVRSDSQPSTKFEWNRTSTVSTHLVSFVFDSYDLSTDFRNKHCQYIMVSSEQCFDRKSLIVHRTIESGTPCKCCSLHL
jgi:hypothetical protein